jgi:serine/threonine-protein kinase
MHKPAPAPVRAVVVPPAPIIKRRRYSLFSRYFPAHDDRWLVHFIAIAIFVGLLAILAITLLRF